MVKMQEQAVKKQIFKFPTNSTAATIQLQPKRHEDEHVRQYFLDIPPLYFSKSKKNDRRKIFDCKTERLLTQDTEKCGSFESFDLGIDQSIKYRKIKSERLDDDNWKDPNCQKKKLPENLKIIYYGPINTPNSSRKKLSRNTQVKTTPNLKKQPEQQIFVQERQPESRYYDKNLTKYFSDINLRKTNLTYFNLEQSKNKRQSDGKVPTEYIIYGLLFLLGVLLLSAMIIR